MENGHPERIVRSILIAEDLHMEVEKYAREHCMSVSGLATRALIEYLKKRSYFLNDNNAQCINEAAKNII